MFWSIFSSLCFERGISPSAAINEMGFSHATVTTWKNGATPRASTIRRIADYFGVPMDTFPKGMGADREPSGFYKTYVDLCKEHGEKPYSLPLKLGLKSNSAVTQWENGSIPRPATLKKIADYFGVTVGYLMGADEEEDKKEEPAAQEDDELLGEFINLYQRLSEDQKNFVLAAMRGVLKEK